MSASLAPNPIAPLTPISASNLYIPSSLSPGFSPTPPSVSVFLYALLTVLFTLAGLAYLILPQ